MQSAISFSAPLIGTMPDLQLEAFADAFGAVLAQQRREWSLEHVAFVAEHRAMLADLRRENAELRAELQASADAQRERVEIALAALKDGKIERGIGIAAIMREGSRLSFELEDGRIFDAGDLPRGEKGEPGQEGLSGRDGRDGLPGLNGTAGDRGIDGKDGLGFDNLEILYDGERTFTFRLIRGEVVKEWRYSVPAQIYRGVHKDGERYDRGDMATWGGSLYHCNEPTAAKPGTGSESWTLAVKRGHDGKVGIQGAKGDAGAPGRPGRDMTQVGPDGSKWG